MRATRASSAAQRLLLCLASGLAACAGSADPADPAIWRIVDQGCNGAPRATAQAEPSPRPDLACDSPQGYAVLKDHCGTTHFLVIPTARRTGIESPELQAADEPNYFAFAWTQRSRTLAALPPAARADADVALAINSRYGRSQEQLHIHIDLLSPQVRAALRTLPLPLAPDTQLSLMGHRYRVEHLDSLASSPFALAARQWDARTVDERARLTLAVASDGSDGFFLLSDRADPAARDRGHAEELLQPRSCG